jgi:hypothetical protein
MSFIGFEGNPIYVTFVEGLLEVTGLHRVDRKFGFNRTLDYTKLRVCDSLPSDTYSMRLMGPIFSSKREAFTPTPLRDSLY